MNIRENLDIYFDLVEDTRSQVHVIYKMSDILFILVTGMLCSCTDLEMIIEFAEEKIDFLKKYTEIENVPCLSTISNILKIINPNHLELCLYGIFSNVLKMKMKVSEKQICIDGKIICSLFYRLLSKLERTKENICSRKGWSEISCYLSSKNANAKDLLSYTRKHWQVESFHWLLDMNYDEDNSRVMNKNSQICLNIVRKHCISIIKKYIENHPVKRKTIIANMRKCLLNEEFLIEVLTYYCNSL